MRLLLALALLLVSPCVSAQVVAESRDHPPTLEIWPERYDQPQIRVKVGARLELGVKVTDPEGVDVKVTAEGLPEGAAFSEEQRILRWTPAPAQRGLQAIRFIAWDGVRQAVRELLIEVSDNRPPAFPIIARTITFGMASSVSFAATDPDDDPLTYSIQGAPRGAIFSPQTGALFWKPGEDDIGRHRVTVTASDGTARVSQELTFEVAESEIRIRRSRAWESFLMPGVGYSVYAPSDRDAFGTFQGISLELLIGAWIHRNENRGPSHGRVYLNAEILDSSDDDVANLFAYSFGFSLSFERNPSRTWLIPVYGLDLGQVFHDTFDSRFQATPYFGFHIFSDPNLFLSARGGYRMVPSDMDHVGGAHAGVNFNFSVW